MCHDAQVLYQKQHKPKFVRLGRFRLGNYTHRRSQHQKAEAPYKRQAFIVLVQIGRETG
jgi:hypothetical protein